MSWKEVFQRIKENEQRREESKIREIQERKRREEEWNQILRIFRPQVEEVFAEFVKTLFFEVEKLPTTRGWRRKSKRKDGWQQRWEKHSGTNYQRWEANSTENTFGIENEIHDTGYRDGAYHRTYSILVSIYPSSVPSGTASIIVSGTVPSRNCCSLEFLNKYSEECKYISSSPYLVNIKILPSDFTKEKLAEVLVDVYEARLYHY